MQAELLATASKLLAPTDGLPPSQADVRRAISTAHYAIFHHAARACSGSLPRASQKTLSRAKSQICWLLDHKDILSACERASIPDNGFPKEIGEFAAVFQRARTSRNAADYDPGSTAELQLHHVLHIIAECADAIQSFNEADPDDRLAFAALVAVKFAYSQKNEHVWLRQLFKKGAQ